MLLSMALKCPSAQAPAVPYAVMHPYRVGGGGAWTCLELGGGGGVPTGHLLELEL